MFVTVGHSTQTIEQFVAQLALADVGTVVDVRRLPGSNRYPWFNQDSLEEILPQDDLGYTRIAALGGRRSIQHDVPDDVNALWRNRSFHNYADYALGADFAAGLAELIAVSAASGGPVAIMCSEAVWWRCHRRIIADHLIARGHDVAHLMPPGRTVPAVLTSGAVLHDGFVQYPAAT